MAGIWVYSENATLAKELLTLAKNLAAQAQLSVSAITLDEELAKELTTLGATKVITLKGNSAWSEAYEQAIAETLKTEEASVVLIGGTVSGKYTAAKAAARLDAGLATDATKVTLEGSELVIERVIYGGLAISTEAIAFPAFVTIPPRSYDISADTSGNGEVTIKEVTIDPKVTIVATDKIERQGVDIGKADKVVGVGRGVGNQEDLPLIQELAETLGAEVGCSRPIAENAKWFPIDRYIGISGKIVKGSLYVGVGVSGQIQHVSGIRDAKTIVAINSDENAPIFAAADYGIVGNYAEIVPALTAAIKKAK